MTDPDKTSIIVVLDKSGSMEIARTDTIGGFNSFVEEQKKLPGTCDITLMQFDSKPFYTYKSKNIQELAEGLSLESYVPSGYTALHDAVGKAINERGAELSLLKEEDRPGKVMVVIITDGAENSSREFNLSKVKEMIEHQKTVYNWDFTFLAANIDTFQTADALGIDAGKSLSFSSTTKGGAARAFASVNMYASNVRGCVAKGIDASDVSYTDKDRQDNA